MRSFTMKSRGLVHCRCDLWLACIFASVIDDREPIALLVSYRERMCIMPASHAGKLYSVTEGMDDSLLSHPSTVPGLRYRVTGSIFRCKGYDSAARLAKEVSGGKWLNQRLGNGMWGGMGHFVYAVLDDDVERSESLLCRHLSRGLDDSDTRLSGWGKRMGCLKGVLSSWGKRMGCLKGVLSSLSSMFGMIGRGLGLHWCRHLVGARSSGSSD